VLAALAPAGARANAITQDACPGTATTGTFLTLGHILENLFIDHSGVWLLVSDSTSNLVRRFDWTGKEFVGVQVQSPGAMSQGPGETVFVNFGDSITGAEQRNAQAGVMTFDPYDPYQPPALPYAVGYNMANGQWRAPNGDIYISNDFDLGLIRIPAHAVGTSVTWDGSFLNDTWGSNGLVALGNTLYSNITFDARSPIEATDLATGAHHTAFTLTAGAASLQPNVYPEGVDPAKPLAGVKGLDDMTTDGRYLYPVANGMGELLRVDPINGKACLIAGGFQNTSSVRIAPESSPYADHDAGTIDFYLSGFDGKIMIVRWRASSL
jgi:hypothetical protein